MDDFSAESRVDSGVTPLFDPAVLSECIVGALVATKEKAASSFWA